MNIPFNKLIEGEIYYQTSNFMVKKGFITQFNPPEDDIYIILDEKRFVKGGSSDNITTERIATPKEKKWLLKCIEANAFVPEPKNITIHKLNIEE